MSDIWSLMNEQIRKLEPFLTARDTYTGRVDIMLDANELWLGGNSGVNRYPDPYCTKLREEMEKAMGLPADMTAVTNGSDEAIDLVIRIFCKPGVDSIMMASPTFDEYRIFATLNGADTIDIPLKKDYNLDVDRMIKVMAEKKPKLVFLCTPNNPTGQLFPEEDIRKIIEHNECITVIDEAYVDFTGKEGWWPEIRKNPRVVILRTMSKAWGLAGARVGMIVGCPEVIEAVRRAKAPYNVSRLSQDAAIGMLRRKDEIALVIDEIVSERARLSSFLKSLPYVTEVFPSDTNFILFRSECAAELYSYLLANAIIVRGCADDPLIKGCLRIAVGSREENERVMEVLGGYRI